MEVESESYSVSSSISHLPASILQIFPTSMNPITRLLKMIFGFYGICAFAVLLLIVTPFYFIVFIFVPKERAYPVAHKYISRPWARATLMVFFIRLKVKNKHLIDPDKAYIFVSNHQSQLDIPSFACSNNNTFRFLAKAELTKLPILGYLIGRLYITVKREDRHDRIKSIEVMMNNLRDSISVFIYPEGTRNRTDKPLLPFHDGAFRLAIEAQMPLAIMTVIDSKRLLSPLRSMELSPGVLHCEWSPVIETKGMTHDDVPLLKEKTKQLMINILSQYEN